MFHAIDVLFARQPSDVARDHCHFVAAFYKFWREREPDFFHAPAHRRRNGEKCAEDNGDFHRATGASFRISSSESTARLISKRRSKQFLAFRRIDSRSAGTVSSQR